jgi:hypothetical protein
MNKHQIETELIALRFNDLIAILKFEGFLDPFSAYQDGVISKRKLIEIIADCLKEE